TALRVLWWRWSGRLEASKKLIWELAGNEPVLIHASAIAVHNVVDSLARMRAAMQTNGPWHTTPAEAAAQALVAPPALLRECPIKNDLPRRLRPGTLVIFRLKKMHAGTNDNDLAFTRNEWSECPAYVIIPRLLEAVWTAAVRDRAAQRFRR